MSGVNLGLSDTTFAVSLRHTASPSTLWTSATAAVALASGGVGGGLAIRVTSMMALDATCTHAASFDSPLALSWQAVNVPAQRQQLMPYVLISGAAFGISHYSAASRNMLSAAASTRWASETGLSAKPAGGFNAPGALFSLTIQQLSATSNPLTTFDAPVMQTVAHRQSIFAAPLPPQPNFPTAGDSHLTILGANFGAHDFSGVVRMGGSSSSSTLWQASDGHVRVGTADRHIHGEMDTGSRRLLAPVGSGTSQCLLHALHLLHTEQ